MWGSVETVALTVALVAFLIVDRNLSGEAIQP